MDINDDAKELVQQLGDAINAAVERSAEVADAIAELRGAGYDVELVLKLEIGLRERDEDGDDAGGESDEDDAQLELTDEDRRTLRSMRIRFDETE
ncbi:MAG: hypothetical protein LC746_14775 [Acidobacteria bacterium]|nr:hypothetical protein [Acidobacteriota bacterium]